MGMRPTFDVGKCKHLMEPMVDKTIGNAFKTVKYVADNMDSLLAYTPNPLKSALVTALTGAVGSQTTLPFPTGVGVREVRSFSVIVRGKSLQLYDLSSGHFTYQLLSNGLYLTLKPTAPTDLVGATILWDLSYEDA